MKKLLSLLSVLTISGSAVPITIAASPYQKENNNKNLKEIIESDGISEIVAITKGSIPFSIVTLNNKLYFKSRDFNVYEYDPATGQQRTVIFKDLGKYFFPGVALNNKIYFGNFDGNVYEYDTITEKLKAVITTNESFCLNGGVALNNKVYFGNSNGNVYEYDTEIDRQKIVINLNHRFISSGVALNNKLYFGSGYSNVYEYDTVTERSKVVIQTGGVVSSSGVALNNKVYFGSWDYKLYEYDPLLKLIEYNVINMKDQIKKEIYLWYKKQNPNSKIKLISNINLDNLIVYDVFLEQTQKNKSSNLEQNLNICQVINKIFVNNNEIEQTQNTEYCTEELKEINSFQKMNGFSKGNFKSENKNWDSNVNIEIKANSGNEDGIPVVIKGKIEVTVKVGSDYEWAKSEIYNLKDISTSYDTKIKTSENNFIITFPSQTIKIPPYSKISFFNKTWKNNIEIILNFFQKVEGIVSADLIDENNNIKTVSVSIKDAMLKLSENDILPSKIIINNDNSINFSYDIKSEKEIIMNSIVIDKIK